MNGEERRRLVAGPLPGERPAEWDERTTMRVTCAGDAPLVLARARAVLAVVLDDDREPWPTPEGWRAALPPWFVARSSPPSLTREEHAARFQRFLRADRDGRLRDHYTRVWSVEGFLFWFHSEARQWAWWDAEVRDDATIVVTLVRRRYPWGLLEWLFRAAGAAAIHDGDGTPLWPVFAPAYRDHQG